MAVSPKHDVRCGVPRSVEREDRVVVEDELYICRPYKVLSDVLNIPARSVDPNEALNPNIKRLNLIASLQYLYNYADLFV